MPYVEADARAALDGGREPRTAGELNYRLTTLVRDARRRWRPRATRRIVELVLMEVNEYLDRALARDGRVGYAQYNEVLGVLDAARREHEAREWWDRDKPPPPATDRYAFSYPRLSVFEQAANVLYAGRVRPYEERKIIENGDVEHGEEEQ